MATTIDRIPFSMNGQSMCIQHMGRQLELYCEKCRELVCPECVSSTHNGNFVVELSEIIPQEKQEIENFIDRTEQNDLVQIGQYIISTDTLLKDNDETFEDLSRQVKVQSDKLKQVIDELTEQTLSLYQEMKDDNTKLLQIYKHDLEMYDKQLKQQIQECKTAIQDGSRIEMYNMGCRIRSETHLPKKPVLNTVRFTPHINPQPNLELAFGKVITSGQDQTLTDQDRSVSTDDQGKFSAQQLRSAKGERSVTANKVLSETKVVDEWKPLCDIESLCPITDDQAWTSVNFSNKINLMDKYGIPIQTIKHEAEIRDISLSPMTHRLWVCDKQNNIMELVSGQLIHRFRHKEKLRCICATANGHVIVGSIAKHVYKFTSQGQTVLTTMADSRTGKPLVCSPHRITECPVTHNIAVIDFSFESDGGDGDERVVVMDTEFNELFIYKGDITSTYKQKSQKGDKKFTPQDVVFDSVGNLIIGEWNTHRVLLLSGDGEFLRIIYTDPDKLQAIGIDKEDVLWVMFWENVKQIQYSNTDFSTPVISFLNS